MYTELEAKKKWCPMARNWSVETLSGIDKMICGHNDSATCSGSDCMMWRWSSMALLETRTSKNDDRLRRSDTEGEALANPPITSEMPAPKGEGWKPVGVPEPADEGEPYFLQSWERDIDTDRKGYCGLAGGIFPA